MVRGWVVRAPASNVSQFVWHPDVHKHVDESLYYLSMASYRFYRSAESELANINRVLGRPFAMYITYGFNDLWLRFWARRDTAEALFSYVTQQLDLRKETPILYVADPIWHIWGNTVAPLTTTRRDNLDRLALSRLEAIQQHGPASPGGTLARESGLLLDRLPLAPYSDRNHIRVLMIIELKENASPERELAARVINSFAQRQLPGTLVSLVKLQASPYFVAELTAPDYWAVDPTCQPLRDALDLAIEKTTTQLVEGILGSEDDYCDFSSVSFGMVVAERLVSKLIPEYHLLSDERKRAVLDIWRKWHHYWIDKRISDFCQRCIQGLVLPDVRVVEDALGSIAPRLERSLLALVRSATEKLFNSLDFANVVNMKPELHKRGWNNLALGDKIELLVRLGEELEDSSVAGLGATLRPMVEIRNKGIHGAFGTGAQPPDEWSGVLEAIKVIDRCLPSLEEVLQTQQE